MKKILLTLIVATSIFAADAQTKKTSKKKAKRPNAEAIANAKFEKQEASKKLMRDSVLYVMHSEDSVRLFSDSLSDIRKDSVRMAYRETGLKTIDSLNKEKYAAIKRDRESWDKSAKSADDITKAAKLSTYEANRVKTINAAYNEKAKAVTSNTSLDEQQKKTQLVALNEERLTKIKAVTGNSRAKKLERERKEYTQKNGADTESSWIDLAESTAKNN